MNSITCLISQVFIAPPLLILPTKFLYFHCISLSPSVLGAAAFVNITEDMGNLSGFYNHDKTRVEKSQNSDS